MTSGGTTAVYLLCYHSQKPDSYVGSERQFLVVEKAIETGEWPYDNGDDPSFYVARHGGPLTWGVCRQDVRNSIGVGDIAAFFSYTPMEGNQVLYRLCAVTTVLTTQDVRAVHRERRFAEFRSLYINVLIRPAKNGWQHDESDRVESSRHGDWLWRIADHGRKVAPFEKRYAQVYRDGFIPNELLDDGGLRLAENYILFSTATEDSYICNNPPEVAIASNGENETWNKKLLQSLTVGTSSVYGGRGYLRAANPTGRNVHRQIHFEMPTPEAVAWRGKLIQALKAADKKGKSGHLANRLAGAAKCS